MQIDICIVIMLDVTVLGRKTLKASPLHIFRSAHQKQPQPSLEKSKLNNPKDNFFSICPQSAIFFITLILLLKTRVSMTLKLILN